MGIHLSIVVGGLLYCLSHALLYVVSLLVLSHVNKQRSEENHYLTVQGQVRCLQVPAWFSPTCETKMSSSKEKHECSACGKKYAYHQYLLLHSVGCVRLHPENESDVD